MTSEITADAPIAAPVLRATGHGGGQHRAAASLTGDLIRRAKSPRKSVAETPLVRLERDPADAPVSTYRPTASASATATPAAAEPPAAPVAAAKPTARTDAAAIRDEPPSVARALRRNMNATQPARGGFARSAGLFFVIYAITCVVMIYAFI